MIWFERYKTELIGTIVVALAIFLYMSQPKDRQVDGNVSPEFKIPQYEEPEKNDEIIPKISWT